MFVPTGGARGRGRPRRRYYDTIKADLQERGAIINARTQQEFWTEVGVLAANRHEWSTVVRGGR